MRRLFALTGTVFMLRCITMLITSLSVPGVHLQCEPKVWWHVDDNFTFTKRPLIITFIDIHAGRIGKLPTRRCWLVVAIDNAVFMIRCHLLSLYLLNFEILLPACHINLYKSLFVFRNLFWHYIWMCFCFVFSCLLLILLYFFCSDGVFHPWINGLLTYVDVGCRLRCFWVLLYCCLHVCVLGYRCL